MKKLAFVIFLSAMTASLFAQTKRVVADKIIGKLVTV
jgi:hypothetical protein